MIVDTVQNIHDWLQMEDFPKILSDHTKENNESIHQKNDLWSFYAENKKKTCVWDKHIRAESRSSRTGAVHRWNRTVRSDEPLEERQESWSGCRTYQLKGFFMFWTLTSPVRVTCSSFCLQQSSAGRTHTLDRTRDGNIFCEPPTDHMIPTTPAHQRAVQNNTYKKGKLRNRLKQKRTGVILSGTSSESGCWILNQLQTGWRRLMLRYKRLQ